MDSYVKVCTLLGSLPPKLDGINYDSLHGYMTLFKNYSGHYQPFGYEPHYMVFYWIQYDDLRSRHPQEIHLMKHIMDKLSTNMKFVEYAVIWAHRKNLPVYVDLFIQYLPNVPLDRLVQDIIDQSRCNLELMPILDCMLKNQVFRREFVRVINGSLMGLEKMIMKRLSPSYPNLNTVM